MDPFISVIVPVYKVEPYLRQCVDSILAQTYKNLEIILVDDGSPDRCPWICDDYEKKDKRIRVIHKENGGLSDARNEGLDIATGDYIGFVDSDDWITPDMYEHLMATILKYHADIAVCDYQESNGKRTLATKSRSRQEKSYTVEEAFREVLLSGEISVTMWNKVYRRSLFDDIRFPSGETFEDGAVFFQLFGKCSCIVHTGKNGYYYRKRAGSITFSEYHSLSRQVQKNYRNLKEYLKTRYPALIPELRYYKVEEDYYLAAKYLQADGSTNSTGYKAVMNTIRRDFPVMLRHPRWSIGKKMKVCLLLSGLYPSVRKNYHLIKNR